MLVKDRINGGVRLLSKWIARDPAYKGLSDETVRWRLLALLSAEVAQAHEAMVGVTGANPHHGVTHTMAEVEYELFDTATAALVVLAHLHRDNGLDVAEALAQHIEAACGRMGVL